MMISALVPEVQQRADIVSLLGADKKLDRTQQLSVFLESGMVVREQFWEYGVMAYVAQTGGFVFLFLGWSFLQLGDLVQSTVLV